MLFAEYMPIRQFLLTVTKQLEEYWSKEGRLRTNTAPTWINFPYSRTTC